MPHKITCGSSFDGECASPDLSGAALEAAQERALQLTSSHRPLVSSISRTTSMTDAPEDDIERGDDSGAQVQVAEELNLSEQTPDSLPNDGPSPEFGHPSGL